MQQVWLVTGSSRGIGRAIAEAALAAGHKVVATARDTSTLADVVERYPGSAHLAMFDVTDFEGAVNVVNDTVVRFGRLDVVVNNAGYGNIGSVEDSDIADIRAVIETNLFGTINVTKASLPIMHRQRSGRFIQLSSVGGRIGSMGRASYSAAKFGVEGFSESLARETSPLGIKVTIVAPGGFRTDFAGSSSQIRAGHSDYESTIGVAAQFQRDYDGAQPGDPAKAASVIVEIAAMEDPPLRLLLGRDAVKFVEQAQVERLEEIGRWRALSESTDFDLTS